MSDNSRIVKDRQHAIRREMDRRGISLKAASMDSGIPYPTFASYFPADQHADPAQIPGGAIYAIVAGNALPLDLVSLLMPDGVQVVRASEGMDHDEIEDLCRDYVATKAKAHHVDSPAGRDLAPCEIDALNVAYLPLRGKVA
jgi:hypothetical protein